MVINSQSKSTTDRGIFLPLPAIAQRLGGAQLKVCQQMAISYAKNCVIAGPQFAGARQH